MSNEDLFAEVRRRLVPALAPARIVVFGSRARGDERPDSDLDLLVVEAGGGSPGDRSERVRGALGRIGVPVDLIVLTPAEFERIRGWRSSIAYLADREGRVLHEAG